MADLIIVPENGTRKEQYEALIPQIESLVAGETDYVANLANISAALKQTFNFFWVGFYLVREDELILGPFQGPVACTRISFGKGVCGTAWKNLAPILVPNVALFPGHIACNAASKSEVVVPLQDHNGAVIGVLDVDSDQLDHFSEIDILYLRKVAVLAAQLL